jgi:hypothetical protein
VAGIREQSREAVVGYIKRQMGHPVLCVELADEHFDDCMDDAEIWVMAHLGTIRQHKFQMNSLINGEFDVPEDCEYVVDVALPEDALNIDLLLNPSAFADTNELPYSYYSNTIGGGFNSGLYQFLQYNEMTRRTLSADVDFTYDAQRRKLIIRPLSNSGTAIMWYLTRVCDYNALSIQQYMLVRRYARATAMYTLGNIRAKYSSVPAAGGQVTLNGSELISNAQLEFGDLQEAMRNVTPPVPFFTG